MRVGLCYVFLLLAVLVTLSHGVKLALKSPSQNSDTALLDLSVSLWSGESTLPSQMKNYIISFKQSTQFTNTFKDKFSWKSGGISLDTYMPEYSFIVQATLDQLEKIRGDDQVEQVMEYRPENKICASVHQEEPNRDVVWHILSISLFKKHTPVDVVSYVRGLLKENEVSVGEITLTSDTMMIIQVGDKIEESASLLAAQQFVHWIERRFAEEEQVLTEMRHASWVAQSNRPLKYPFTDSGITGKGQVVAVGDTGVDVNSCYFYDPDNEVPFVSDSNAVITAHSSKHRKLELYYTFVNDRQDVNDGHGTHVAAIATANFLVNANSTVEAIQHNGVAYGAKLAMFDAGCQNSSGCTCAANTPSPACPCNRYATGLCNFGSVTLPVDLRVDYFSKPYAAGARIHSSSIGSSIGQPYNDKSAAIDEFVYNNDDMVVVFSAGNSGSATGIATITGGFKQAKNQIVVGASVSALESWYDKFSKYQDYTSLTIARRNELQAMYGCPYSGSPACEFLSGMNETEKCCQLMGSQCNFNPPYTIQGPPSNPFAKYTALDCCWRCNQSALKKHPKVFDFISLAALSSVGPAMDGRIKPDVVSPGYFVHAARANNKQCDTSDPISTHLLYKAGTSMATPVVAGAAALVRQYFVDGFYNVSGKSVPFNPSAALVRATIINSARPLKGYTQSLTYFDTLLPGVRRLYEGYGLLNLENVLPLNSNLSLFIDDRRNISSGMENIYSFSYTPVGEQPLVLTLAWTDPPASLSSSVSLVNDLDLQVTYTKYGSNITLWGNQVDSSTNRPDRLNNIEKITIADTTGITQVTIRVIGENVPTGYQLYSLVVSGHSFEAKEIEESFHVEDSNRIEEHKEEEEKSSPSNSVDIPVWLLVFLVLGLVFFVLASAAGCAFFVHTKLATQKAKSAQNHEMLERFVASTYTLSEQQ